MNFDPVLPSYEFTIDAGTNIICRERSGRSKSLSTADAIEELLKIPSEAISTNDLSLSAFRSRFLTPIALRQLLLYYDSAHQSSPVAALTWAFLSTDAIQHYTTSGYLRMEDWNSGADLWILDFVVAREYSPIGWIVRHLHNEIFPEYSLARSIRNHDSRDIDNCRIWRNPRSHDKAEKQPSSDNSDHQQHSSRQRRTSHDDIIDHVTGLAYQNARTDEIRNILIQNILDEQLAICILNRANCELVHGDHDARALTIVSQQMARKGFQTPQYIVRHSTRTSMPFSDQSFDTVVTSIYCLEDCELKERAGELSRILRIGGRLVLAPILSPRDRHSSSSQENSPDSFPELVRRWASCLVQAGLTELKLYDTSTGQSVPWIDPSKADDSSQYREESQGLDTQIFLSEKKTHVVGKPATRSHRPLVTVVTLSGGIDSTHDLWKLATTTDHVILAHHVNIVNKEDRSDVERICARRIADYVSNTCRPVLYSESTVDHRGFSWYGYDVMEVGFEVGVRSNSYLFDNNRTVDHWTMGHCEEEGGWSSRWQHVKACLAASCYPHLPPEFLPLPILKKAAEIAELPEELMRLTWYCRRPIVTRSGYRTCNACKTCRIVHGTMS